MSSVVNVKVFYGKGIRLSIKDKSFKEAMNLVWDSPAFSNYDPLKIQLTTTGKILYADRQAFLHYLKGEIDIATLITQTQCDELYRNTKDYLTEYATIVDAGSLWKSYRNELTLIDDDNIATTKHEISIFEIAE
jgi:hypothetical protein